MENKVQILNYKISNDPHLLDDKYEITEGARKHLEKCYEIALDGKKSGIKTIEKMVEQYPQIPQFKNYLSVVFQNTGDSEKTREVNRWIIAEHPDYLFGKLNLAQEHLQNEEFDKIPELLGNDMELKCLYPDRDVFHLDEVTGFLSLAIKYFALTGQMEQAEKRFELLNDVASESIIPEDIEEFMMYARLRHGAKWFDELNKDRIEILVAPQKESSTSSKIPEFTHEEVVSLYEIGLYIEKSQLESLLSLPRESLIHDLETVLKDSVNRFAYFSNMAEEEGWDEERMNFVIHAVFLLGELKAKESLPAILEILRQSEDYLQLYFGDFLTEALWEPLYKVAHDQFDVLLSFMREPGIYTYVKTEIGQTVEQVALHQPERRLEVIEWFREVFEFYTACDVESNIIDSDVIGLLMCSAIEIEADELLPSIEQLFKKGYVSIGICGDYKSVVQGMNKPSPWDRKIEILPIAERYQNITTTWAGYTDSSTYDSNINSWEPKIITAPYVREEKKIGRNEPCPCGSGKKYKKCCLQ
ncbi:MAG: DUF1186 domain-containing protein [Crocinitomicaceae bacterium]